MVIADVLLLVGAATVAFGLVSTRFSHAMAAKKRWILTVGLVILALGVVFGIPDMVSGFKEGMAEARK